MKFTVIVEAKVREDVEVEADSHEEAVAKVRDMNLQKSAVMKPTWVDTQENVESTGELQHEVICYCEWCNTPIVHRDRPELPWLYGGDPNNEHGGLVCFKCLKDKGYIAEDGHTLKKGTADE